MPSHQGSAFGDGRVRLERRCAAVAKRRIKSVCGPHLAGSIDRSIRLHYVVRNVNRSLYHSITQEAALGAVCGIRSSSQSTSLLSSGTDTHHHHTPSKHQHHWSIDRRVPMASIGGGASTGAAAGASGASSSLDPKREFRRQVDVTVGTCVLGGGEMKGPRRSINQSIGLTGC